MRPSEHVTIAFDEDHDHDHAVILGGRPFRRSALIAAAVALFVIAGTMWPAQADQTTRTVGAGFATMTSQKDCPKGLVVSLSFVETETGSWDLFADTVHSDCTVRLDLPFQFHGNWDYLGHRQCDFLTGANCFHGVDRPGMLSVGAIPASNVLQQTKVIFVRGQARIEGMVNMWRTPRIAQSGRMHASYQNPGSISGLGEVTPPGCAPGAYKVPFSAVNDGGGIWVIDRPAGLGASCNGLVYGAPLFFVGPWNPITGGCVEDLIGGGKICIGAMPDRGVLTNVPFKFCPDAVTCFSGSTSLSRA